LNPTTIRSQRLNSTPIVLADPVVAVPLAGDAATEGSEQGAHGVEVVGQQQLAQAALVAEHGLAVRVPGAQ
jgi:hypothetical protein